MLNNKEIKHIAQLARIELDEKTEEKLKKELSSVLDYVNQLNTVNTDGVEPLYQTTGLVNALRADEHRGDFVVDEKLDNLLIGQAPHTEKRFVKVKSVLSHK